MRNADVTFFCLVLCLALFCAASAEVKKSKYKGSPVGTWIKNIRKNSVKFGKQVDISQKILAGSNAEHNPHFVAIETFTKICGGVLVDRHLVLTSATCVEEVTDYTNVYFGQYSVDNTTEYQVHQVPYYYVWPFYQYDCSSLNNDLALVYIYDTVSLSESVRVARFYEATANTSFDGMTAYMYGFGTTSADSYVIPNVLQTKTVEVQPISVCQAFPEFEEMDPSIHLCTKSTGEQSGACHGDEGGPVMVDGSRGEKLLIGITSYQPYQCPPSADFPSRHTKLGGFFWWLQSYFRMNLCVLEKRMKLKKLEALKKDKKHFI